MLSGIRKKLLVWLILLALPISGTCIYALHLISASNINRIESHLSNARHYEIARIDHAIAGYRKDVDALTTNLSVRKKITRTMSVLNMPAFRNNAADRPAGSTMADNHDEHNSYPFELTALELIDVSRDSGAELADVMILDLQGNVIGKSPRFSWQPYDLEIGARAIRDAQMYFGNAFRTPAGQDRLGVAAPMFDERGYVVGGFLLELDLLPLIDLIAVHEGFGDTSEAYLAQSNANGDTELITQLRFDRDAAFTRMYPKNESNPIKWSLNAFGGKVLHAQDYRGHESIFSIQTITHTGWGLTTKIDVSEVLQPVVRIQRNVLLSAAATLFIAIASWFLFLNPIGKRLQRAAGVADQIVKGDFKNPINDTKSDEIGEMSRSIDTLASDLETEFKLRSDVEARLRFQADHDELTGLSNRQYGNRIIESLKESHEPVTVFFLDLDGFKSVNDNYGHDAGDEVLVQVADRLKEAIGDSDTVSRWGGDEFVIIEKGLAAADAAEKKSYYQELFVEPTVTSFGTHDIGCSIGDASCAVGESLEEALSAADELMYERKNARKVAKHSETIKHSMVEKALVDNRVQVWLQPVFDIRTQRAVGAEVLSRIKGERGTIHTPDMYMTEIAGSEIAQDYDAQVIRTTLALLAQWQQEGMLDQKFLLGLNVMQPMVNSRALPALLKKSIDELSLNPNNIVIEVSEEVGSLNQSVIEEVRALGVLIAIDDIGLHKVKLETLIKLQPDIIKINPFVEPDDFNISMEENVVMRSLIKICKDLNIVVVMSGIESMQHKQKVDQLGIGFMQGFYFDAASSAEVFVRRWSDGQKMDTESPSADFRQAS